MSRCLKIYLKTQILNKKEFTKNLNKKKVNFTKIQKEQSPQKRALLIDF